MYFVFLELEHDGSIMNVGDYFTEEQLQNITQAKQKGIATYQYADILWNVTHLYYLELTKAF